MTAREKFKFGDRVFLSEHGKRQDISPVHSGTVTGFGRDAELVRIRRDGRSEVVSYHMDFWEPSIASASVEPLP